MKGKIGRVRRAVQLISLAVFLTGAVNFGGWILPAALLAGVAAGRIFCGWICPLGFLQDTAVALLIQVPGLKKLRGRKIPAAAGFAAPVMLLLFLVTDLTGWAPPALLETILAAAVLVLAAGGLLFRSRFFCRTLCPAGFLLGWTNRVRLMGLRLDPDRCTGCGACSAVCPADLEPPDNAGFSRSRECISCGRCLEVCPSPGALKIGWRAGKKDVSSPGEV